jgi:hypothetical protein
VPQWLVGEWLAGGGRLKKRREEEEKEGELIKCRPAFLYERSIAFVYYSLGRLSTFVSFSVPCKLSFIGG